MLSSISIASLPDVGNAAELPANTAAGFRGGIIVKVMHDAFAALSLEDIAGHDGYLVAFGTTCPHMGCVVNKVQHALPNGDDPETLVTRPCPCHGSTFDLRKGGLVILGPATQDLPQLKLKFSTDGTQVEAIEWQTDVDPNSENWPFDSSSAGGA